MIVFFVDFNKEGSNSLKIHTKMRQPPLLFCPNPVNYGEKSNHHHEYTPSLCRGSSHRVLFYSQIGCLHVFVSSILFNNILDYIYQVIKEKNHFICQIIRFIYLRTNNINCT